MGKEATAPRSRAYHSWTWQGRIQDCGRRCSRPWDGSATAADCSCRRVTQLEEQLAADCQAKHAIACLRQRRPAAGTDGPGHFRRRRSDPAQASPSLPRPVQSPDLEPGQSLPTSTRRHSTSIRNMSPRWSHGRRRRSSPFTYSARRSTRWPWQRSLGLRASPSWRTPPRPLAPRTRVAALDRSGQSAVSVSTPQRT